MGASSDTGTSVATKKEGSAPPGGQKPGGGGGDDPALAALAAAEDQEDAQAREFAQDEDLADRIAEEAAAGTSNDLEAELQEQAAAALEEAAAADVLPSSAVYDVESLVAKYGGADKVYADHGEAASKGYFTQMPQLKEWLYDTVENFVATARQTYVRLEHESGGRLMLLGTNHLLRESLKFARDVMQAEQPECLVLERRLGDDGLQRLTVPEELYMDLAMRDPPGKFRSTDGPIDRARSFQEDRIWLEASPGWKDIGGEAAIALEFGAAFEEFVKQRRGGRANGPRGGTVCFADSDLRGVADGMEGSLLPSLSEMAYGASIPLRDLQMAQAIRAAMRTHSSVVAVVGRGHLAGISSLLLQDSRIRLLEEGMDMGEPIWEKDFEDNGKQWEREAIGVSNMFLRLAETADKAPLGTYLSAEAALELMELRDETERRMREQGVDAAEPAAPLSSELGADFFRRGLIVTPRDEAELRRWLAGERVEQEAGNFPFQNRQRRKKAPPLPGTGFPLD